MLPGMVEAFGARPTLLASASSGTPFCRATLMIVAASAVAGGSHHEIKQLDRESLGLSVGTVFFKTMSVTLVTLIPIIGVTRITLEIE